MAGVCGTCGLSCADDNSVIKCTGSCERVFHVKCIKADGVKTRNVSRDFKCEECLTKKSGSSVGSNKSSSASTAITKEFFLSTLESFKQDVFAEMRRYAVAGQLEELQKSVEFLSNSVDETNSLLTQIRNDYAEIKKQNLELQSENKKLNAQVSGLEYRLRNLEQYSRKNNIEISGIPQTPHEDVMAIVKDVGAAIGEKLEDNQVAAAHRVPSYKTARTPSIVVQFQSRQTRDAWIANFREKKPLTANKVNRSFPNNPVYVGEHISPENKVFLAQIKERSKQMNIRFAWFREGKFFVRKGEGEKCHKINTLEDLEKIA